MKNLLKEIKKIESEDRAKKKSPVGAMYIQLYSISGLTKEEYKKKLRQLLNEELITVVPTINDYRINST